jgi:hypothetical protein
MNSSRSERLLVACGETRKLGHTQHVRQPRMPMQLTC